MRFYNSLSAQRRINSPSLAEGEAVLLPAAPIQISSVESIVSSQAGFGLQVTRFEHPEHLEDPNENWRLHEASALTLLPATQRNHETRRTVGGGEPSLQLIYSQTIPSATPPQPQQQLVVMNLSRDDIERSLAAPTLVLTYPTPEAKKTTEGLQVRPTLGETCPFRLVDYDSADEDSQEIVAPTVDSRKKGGPKRVRWENSGGLRRIRARICSATPARRGEEEFRKAEAWVISKVKSMGKRAKEETSVLPRSSALMERTVNVGQEMHLIDNHETHGPISAPTMLKKKATRNPAYASNSSLAHIAPSTVPSPPPPAPLSPLNWPVDGPAIPGPGGVADQQFRETYEAEVEQEIWQWMEYRGADPIKSGVMVDKVPFSSSEQMKKCFSSRIANITTAAWGRREKQARPDFPTDNEIAVKKMVGNEGFDGDGMVLSRTLTRAPPAGSNDDEPTWRSGIFSLLFASRTSEAPSGRNSVVPSTSSNIEDLRIGEQRKHLGTGDVSRNSIPFPSITFQPQHQQIQEYENAAENGDNETTRRGKLQDLFDRTGLGVHRLKELISGFTSRIPGIRRHRGE